uniref:Uncharacterized protein n=1 Tax=Anopheles atroparvus TaxID=41427 RepID=A0AAG5CN82_ANOAO
MCSNRFPLLLLITAGALTAGPALAEHKESMGRGRGGEVHQADVSASEPVAVRLGKAAKSGPSPITYIKTLPATATLGGGGDSGEDHGLGHPAKRLANKRGKPRTGNRLAPKSLDVAAPKDLSNAELFGKLGLGKVRPATNHHKKRLAEESRHYGRPDDSHMYVIKLPPNPYYYTHNAAPQNSISSVGKQVPVGFKSNGKPARIYHWNIPVLKKMLGAKQSRHPNSRRHDDIDELIDIKEIPTWSKPWEGAPREKSLLKASHGPGDADRAGKRKLPTYYAPSKKAQSGGGKTKKHTGSKYNTNGSNGKPQSFYILGDKDSRTKIVGHPVDV